MISEDSGVDYSRLPSRDGRGEMSGIGDCLSRRRYDDWSQCDPKLQSVKLVNYPGLVAVQ